MKFVLLLFLLITTKAFSQSLVTKYDVDTLRQWMVGSFASTQQASLDPSYLDIHLNANIIWTHRIDGVWLYSEQAISTSLDKPYRQVVCHLFQLNDTTIVDQSYNVIEPSRVTGAWHNPKLFDPLRIDSLKLQVGCAIMLHKFGEYYYGSTPGKQCATDPNGASYITTEIKIYADKITSWERGWDMYDKQIWGGVNNGYVFMKQPN